MTTNNNSHLLLAVEASREEKSWCPAGEPLLRPLSSYQFRKRTNFHCRLTFADCIVLPIQEKNEFWLPTADWCAHTWKETY